MDRKGVLIESSSRRFPKAAGFTLGSERGRNPAGFVKNGVVRATVLKTIDRNTAIISINGCKFSAQTQMPLTTGSVLMLAVKQLAPIPVLQPLGFQNTETVAVNMAAILAALKENIWKALYEKIIRAGTTSDKTLWEETVKNLPQKLLSGGGPACLQRMIENSGLGWEAKLGRTIREKRLGADAMDKLIGSDLKGFLSRIAARCADADPEVGKLLLALKNLQLWNRNGYAQEHKIFVPLPVQLPNGNILIIQLLLQFFPKEENDHDRRFENFSMKISLLLDLTRIGPVRGDFELKGNLVAGCFGVATPETRNLIESGTPALVQCLSDKGFVVERIECRLKAAEVVAEPLIMDITPETASHIHLVA